MMMTCYRKKWGCPAGGKAYLGDDVRVPVEEVSGRGRVETLALVWILPDLQDVEGEVDEDADGVEHGEGEEAAHGLVEADQRAEEDKGLGGHAGFVRQHGLQREGGVLDAVVALEALQRKGLEHDDLARGSEIRLRMMCGREGAGVVPG